MMTRLATISLFLFPGCAAAAPPTLTHLYPAGGKQGTTVTVTVAGTFDKWPVRAWVSGKGVEAKPAKERGQLTLTIAADATPGPRWLRLHDDQGGSLPRRFFVGVLPEVIDKEPNDEAAKPQLLAGDSVVNGRLEKAGDVDCFGLKLKKGQTLVASVVANRQLGSPMDGVLQIVSDKGFVLAQNNDHRGLDPQVTFTVPEDGTYVARLFAFPALPDSSIRLSGGERYIYRLTLTTGAFAEHAWPLAVPSGKKVGFIGWNLNDSSSPVDVIETGADAGVAVAKGVAGDASVRLEPHPCVLREKGTQKLTLPVTVSGRFDKGEKKHLFAIAGRKGQRLEAQVESASAGFSLDGVLRLLDQSGKQLARAQAARLHLDPELNFVLPADGTYQLELSDAQRETGPRQVYRLRVLVGEPDYALSVTTDRFTIAAGKTLDIPVTVARRNGFAAELTLEAEGLPVGVSVEAVPASKGATLRLKADAKTPAGGTAIRIVGKAKGGKSRVARATLTDPVESVELLWLNVSK